MSDKGDVTLRPTMGRRGQPLRKNSNIEKTEDF